jgi:sugar phosphate isomerase/epimerase
MIALAALGLLVATLGGCAGPAELDPNHKASLEAWKEVELKKLEPVDLLDMRATEGKSIENLQYVKVSSTKGGGNATPPPAYKPPPSPWDRVWSFLETAVGVGGRTVTTVVGIQEGASVLRAGYSAAGDRTVVGRDLNGGPGAGSDRDKPWTNYALPEGQ